MDEKTALRVFITDGTSGLGRAITRQLVSQGHQVAGVVSTLAEANQLRAEGGLPAYNDLFRASEIASTLKMLKTDVVVNNAPQAINSLPLPEPDWAYATRLLAEGAPALAAAAAEAGVRLLVHLSYTFLYGDTHGQWADESYALQTEDGLFAAAAAAEKAVLGGAAPGCVLRAGFTYGPNSAAVHALRRALISRGAVTVGSGEAGWVHNRDLAQAVGLVIDRQPAGEIFNIADEHPLSPAEFVNRFADRMGVAKPSNLKLPFGLGQYVQHPSLRALLAVSVRASAAKAREQLGWQPQFASVDAGIDQTLLAWRAAEAVQ
jgi:nucleoside-diphosphate-sugar epimerase